MEKNGNRNEHGGEKSYSKWSCRDERENKPNVEFRK